MKEARLLLTGKWAFIGAEKFVDTEWVESPNFINTMTWEFHPQYFGAHKVIGQLTEFSETGDTEQFSYSYNPDTHLLVIELTPNTQLSSQEPVALLDKYEVIECDKKIIKISILNYRECPPPYFRYILREV